VTLTRELTLARPRYGGGDWPGLRALLLGDAAPGNRLILLRETEAEKP
jgi:hypothetical protein